MFNFPANPKLGDQIKCSNLRNHTKPFTGCGECGGYEYTAEYVSICVNCNAKGWVRPGAVTIYDGKKMRTLDGKEYTVYLGGKCKCGCL